MVNLGLLLPALLAACWMTDADIAAWDERVCAGMSVDVNWGEEAVTVEVEVPEYRQPEEWALGLVRNGLDCENDCWIVEDCMANWPEDAVDFEGYTCHRFDADEALSLSYVDEGVQTAGRTTGVHPSQSGQVTFALFDESDVDEQRCCTWGADPEYFTEPGCLEL